MSQTETLLLFVLGFCTALFVVLLFGRGFWALIGSWSGWRETRRVPTAIRELQAERDSLKAEKAMMAQKLESTFNDMRMRMAEQMAEVSRNRNRLLDLGQTLKERDTTLTDVQSQTEDKSSLLSSLQNQIEDNVKTINLAYAQVAQRDEEHARMQNELKEAHATLLLRNEKIRILTNETMALRDLGTGDMPHSATAIERPSTAPVLVTSPINSNFEQRFANNKAGNPLVAESDAAEIDAFNTSSESDDVDRGVSNVLSLAERVRRLQSGGKK